jgi:DNA primase
MSEWINATRRNPCAICGRPDWCRCTADGVVQDCYRQASAGSIERQDKNGATFWRYRDGSPTPVYRRQDVPPPPSTERAGVLDRDRIYRELLRLFYLTPEHRHALRTRGLTNADMERCGYGSLPLMGRYRVVKHLIHLFGQDLITKIPGCVTRAGEDGSYMTLAGSPGLLIPARNADGYIFGLAIRCDDPGDGGRYRWLSSKRHGGPGAEMAVHVPLFHGDTNTVRITEGTLKSDVATALSDVLTLGIPGCAQWRMVIPVLERINPALVLIAFDSDWRTNPRVAMDLGQCAKSLHKAGFDCKVEDWPPSQGKGIDDLLAAGHQPRLKDWQYAIMAKHEGRQRKTEVAFSG